MNRRALLCLPLLLAALAGCSSSAEPVPGPTSELAKRAQVCDGASDRAICVQVPDREQVAALEAAFLAGPTGGEDCPGLDQQVYRIVFTTGADQQTVDVPAACGPTLAPPRYEVTADERKLVADLLPDPAAVAELVNKCVARDSGLPAPEYVGLRGEKIDALQTSEQPVRILGRDGKCFGGDRAYREDRVNLLILDDTVVWARRY